MAKHNRSGEWERSVHILARRLQGRSLAEIAEELDVSRQRVHFLLKAVLQRLLRAEAKWQAAEQQMAVMRKNAEERVQRAERWLTLAFQERTAEWKQSVDSPIRQFELDFIDIDQLNVSVPTYNALRRASIRTAAQCAAMCDWELREFGQMDRQCIQELRSAIAQLTQVSKRPLSRPR
jgi:predicted DNA-binding protein YlxM (UPF0122 family)